MYQHSCDVAELLSLLPPRSCHRDGLRTPSVRQILLNSSGAVVARMPRPALQPGRVLVRSRYSLISAGTELAALAPGANALITGSDLRERSAAASRLLAKAMRDPRKASRRVVALARGRVARAFPASPAPAHPPVQIGELTWAPASGAKVEAGANGSLAITRDSSPNAYQALSAPVDVPEGHAPAARIRGEVDEYPVLVGLLDRDQANWVGHVMVGPGSVDDRFIFPPGEPRVTLVLANGDNPDGGLVRLEELSVELLPPEADGAPVSDIDHQGWNVGYSLAGEVVAVGEGVTDIRPGDLVACAGAGFANHAE
jgi:hypothetical protein